MNISEWNKNLTSILGRYGQERGRRNQLNNIERLMEALQRDQKFQEAARKVGSMNSNSTLDTNIVLAGLVAPDGAIHYYVPAILCSKILDPSQSLTLAGDSGERTMYEIMCKKYFWRYTVKVS